MTKLILIFLFGLTALLVIGFLYTAKSSKDIEQRIPPIGQFIEIDGLRLHYLDQGQGFPIVLLHGASTSLLDFTTNLIPALSKHYRVLAFDRPGHGYSERDNSQWPNPAQQAELIGKALSQLDIEKCIWVGHSWSGSVVLAALLNQPQQTMTGVLLAGASHPWDTGVAWYNDVAETPLLGSLFAWTLVYPAGEAQMESAIQSVFTPSSPPENYINNTGLFLSLRPRTFLANAADLSRLSDFLAEQSKQYHTIQQPLLLITDKEDTIVGAWNHSERLLKQIPHAELIYLDKTGHALHHIHSEKIASLIVEVVRPIAKSKVLDE